MTMQSQSMSRRALIKASAALAAALPFLKSVQPAQAATSKVLGLASTHPVGKTRLYTSVSPAVFVTRTAVNTWVAFDNVCTHAGANLVLQGKQAYCRSHGAAFDLKTGKPTNNVTRTPLKSYSISIRKGKIYISM